MLLEVGRPTFRPYGLIAASGIEGLHSCWKDFCWFRWYAYVCGGAGMVITCEELMPYEHARTRMHILCTVCLLACQLQICPHSLDSRLTLVLSSLPILLLSTVFAAPPIAAGQLWNLCQHTAAPYYNFSVPLCVLIVGTLAAADHYHW
jgi:hypothetical protein